MYKGITYHYFSSPGESRFREHEWSQLFCKNVPDVNTSSTAKVCTRISLTYGRFFVFQFLHGYSHARISVFRIFHPRRIFRSGNERILTITTGPVEGDLCTVIKRRPFTVVYRLRINHCSDQTKSVAPACALNYS